MEDKYELSDSALDVLVDALLNLEAEEEEHQDGSIDHGTEAA